MHAENMFITLTYDERHLPTNSSLNVKDIQKFIKRYRKRIAPKKIRFLQCGEYGDKTNRPHHHAAIFGARFDDQVEIEPSAKGKQQFQSPLLTELWGMGRCTISELNYTSANYLARYVIKKISGPPAEEHYSQINEITGEIIQVKPEFITMSRRPGIGYLWIQKYLTDVYPSDSVVIKGKAQKPPSYYDAYYKKRFPQEFQQVVNARLKKYELQAHDNSPQRREDKEIVKNAQIKSLTRL